MVSARVVCIRYCVPQVNTVCFAYLVPTAMSLCSSNVSLLFHPTTCRVFSFVSKSEFESKAKFKCFSARKKVLVMVKCAFKEQATTAKTNSMFTDPSYPGNKALVANKVQTLVSTPPNKSSCPARKTQRPSFLSTLWWKARRKQERCRIFYFLSTASKT